MPGKDQEVLAYNGEIFYALYVHPLYLHGFFDLVEESVNQDVTHWMPLPNPPQQENLI
jgi:hypothetical protein